jgi:hypothetical protein
MLMVKKNNLGKIRIVEIDAKNILEHPEVICFINPKHPAYSLKLGWLKKRFAEDLKIKLLYRENETRCIGFIEYLPGESAWRAVDAKGYLFIHCIWIYKNVNKNHGYASILINESVRDARAQNRNGVAVIASNGPFMAGKNLFLKNGFRIIDASGTYTLLIRQLKKGALVRFNDWEKELSKYKGLHVIYSLQCPWVARSIDELQKVADESGLKVRFKELKTARQAQRAPSIYGAFTLVYNRRILADHYISPRRFRNILQKELPRIKS